MILKNMDIKAKERRGKKMIVRKSSGRRRVRFLLSSHLALMEASSVLVNTRMPAHVTAGHVFIAEVWLITSLKIEDIMESPALLPQIPRVSTQNSKHP